MGWGEVTFSEVIRAVLYLNHKGHTLHAMICGDKA